AFSRASVVESYPTTLNELLGVSGWANDMDNALSFQCPSGQSINAIVSYHHNHYEDRRWKFACKATAGITDNCSWSGYANNWDEVMSFSCAGQSVIAGWSSDHHNHYEDRRMKFRCCQLQTGAVLTNCALSGNANSLDGWLKYGVPANKLLYGVTSWHSNHHEDRVFRFQTCSKV
ncbi:hypothetical protein BaRGS_00039640, partial [Batillaria attramentaria]